MDCSREAQQATQAMRRQGGGGGGGPGQPPYGNAGGGGGGVGGGSYNGGGYNASANGGFVAPVAGPGQITTTHMVPSNRVGLCIGKGGETVRQLQEKTGAKIVITPDREADKFSTERAVTIIGNESSIAAAKKLINDIVFVVFLFLFLSSKSSIN